MENCKTLKEYCREAKKRLKSGFWQSYHKDLTEHIEQAEKVGLPTSKVKEYYCERVIEGIKGSNTDEKEEFYQKVKEILDKEGEIPNAIGRLTDKEYYATLTYEEKQRYSLNLSTSYLEAVERYNKEKAISVVR